MSTAIATTKRLSERIADSPKLAIAVVAAASLVLAIFGNLARWARQPTVTDEQSYLLAAETFASGRMTNPPHPMWEHFQTDHILMVPTYQSKYPPGQGLLLALGKALGGHPRVGVWLSFAALGAALCWMLQPWVGRRLAFYGTLAYMAWIASSYWSFTYWGGSLAACGGALVYGALRRLEREPRIAQGVLLASGILVLANTRMYEGLLATVPVALYFARWLWRRESSPSWPRRFAVVVPLGLMLALGGVLMAQYNRAVTGSATALPYVVYARQYEPAPVFALMRTRHAPLDSEDRPYSRVQLRDYRNLRTVRGFAVTSLRRLGEFVFFFAPLPLLLAASVAVRCAVRDRWIAGAVGVVCFAFAGMLLTIWFSPHYAAPLTGLVLAVLLACLRWLRRLPLAARTRFRRALATSTLLWACAALGVARGLAYFAVKYRSDRTSGGAIRARLAAQLWAAGGRHLVMVRYRAGYPLGRDWVFNAADIDRAPVVWAAEISPEKDKRLLQYFVDRRVWVVQIDGSEQAIRLNPYDGGRQSPRAAGKATISACDLASQTIYVSETCVDQLRARYRRLRAANALDREWKVSPITYLLTSGEWESAGVAHDDRGEMPATFKH